MGTKTKRKTRSVKPYLIILLLVTAVAVAMFVLPVDRMTANLSAEHSGYEVPEEYDDLEYRYYYNRLSESEQLAYRLLVEQLPDFPDKVAVPELDSDELSEVFEAVSYDNPELFFLDNKCTLSRVGVNYYFRPEYTMDKATYESELAAVQKVADEILTEVPEDTEDYLVELYLHDKLGEIATYSGEGETIYTPYGMLVLKQANCEGYSRTMQMLLKRCGIVNRLITGVATESDGTSENHMWNIVTINGKEYNLDLTWDDYRISGELKTTASLAPSHIYFNRSSEVFAADHTPKDESMWADCTDDTNNFYVAQNVAFSEYNSKVKSIIRDDIVWAAQHDKPSFELYFKNAESYATAKAGLIDLEEIYELLASANTELSSSQQVDATRIQYTLDDDHHVMRFFLL